MENLQLPEAGDANALLAMIRLSDDPEAAEARLRQLVKAAAEHDAAAARAKDVIAQAAESQRKAEVAVADLTTRTETFQSWSSGTEKALRSREGAVHAAEENLAKREQDCRNQEADIATRVAEHTFLMRRLRAHLDEFVA
jgi:hypothetical protein